jgi:hypothetical protein
MIEDFIATRKNIKMFLRKITERVKRNNKRQFQSRHYGTRL